MKALLSVHGGLLLIRADCLYYMVLCRHTVTCAAEYISLDAESAKRSSSLLLAIVLGEIQVLIDG
jgi:hypothetical protein